MKKRLLSWLLVLVMLLGMLPATAVAEDHAGQVRVIVENATYAKADGAAWEGILVDKWVDLTSTSTIMTCIVDALGDYSQTGASAGYITEINGLKERDGGAQAGWMATLNDFFTGSGLTDYTAANGKLSAGDEVHVQYTCNWGADLGNDWTNTDRTLKSLEFSDGILSPNFNKDTHSYTLTIPADAAGIYVTPTASNKQYQVRISVDGKEVKRSTALSLAKGNVITVTCGDESWDAMSASKATVETYTVTVLEEKDSANVIIRSQAAGAYLHGLAKETVTADLAESYGYTDSVDGVSALDALVRAHELAFGEAFTKATAKEYLDVSSSGWISKLFGTATYACGFYVNEGYPNDGTESGYGGYNGTYVTTQELKSGDVVDFYIMSDDTAYSDYYTWIDAPAGAGAGQKFDVTLKGFYAMEGYRYKTPAELRAAAKAIEGSCLAWIDAETGEATAIANVTTDENGKATLTAPEKVGTYYLAATGDAEEELYCLMNPVTFDVVAAPESITVKYVGGHEANGQLVGKKGDTFQLKAYDQNGKETPAAWSTTSSWTGTISQNGLITLTAATSAGSTSYFYYTAASVADSSVKYEGKLEITGYEISEYNRTKTVALSADGQTAKTANISGGVKDHTIWSYDMPEGIAALAQDPGNGTQINFNLYRPGTIQVTLALDIDKTMTSSATITITGAAVEDAQGTQGKTYLEISKDQAHPTAQLTAYLEEGRSVASWESSDTSVVTVDENGKLTAQAVGSALITVTDSEGTKGGIKVVVTDADTPYFESLEFLTSAISGWTAGETFQPTTLEYELPIKTYSTSTLTLQKTTLYNAEKYTATAEYTDVNGEKQTVEVKSGEMTMLQNQPFDASTLIITLADKNDPENKTVYTFHVTRPRDTNKAIKASSYSDAGGIVLVPEGRALDTAKYENYAEGTIFRLKDDGSYVTSGANRTTGPNAAHYSYRTFLFENEKSFSLTFKGSTAYQHLRYSTDGKTWIELPQGEGTTEKLGFTDGKATVTLQILDDKTYSDNVKAGKDGFAESEPVAYTVEVVQLDVSAADAQLLTAETETGDWYPKFSPELYSYNIVVPNGTTTGTLTYTVSEGATVKLGNTEQTPDENGVYTLALKTSAQTLTITAPSGIVNTYSVKLLAKSKYDVPDRVEDYLCIGSQYTNGAGWGGFGINPETTLAGSLKSLGNFGGYITYYFENAIKDDPNNKYGIDFYVYGNSSENNQDSMAELGQVYVSEDGKTWFALAGSEHYEDKAIWDYTITYTKRADGMSEWTDNQGNSMISTAAVTWPKQSLYYMNDVGSRDSYSFTGVLFKSQEDDTVMGTSQTSSFAARAKFGYADYYANGTLGADVNPYVEKPTQSNGFDLAWAVDANGSPVKLTEVHYVKVATASNIWAGAFKEKSSEVTTLIRTTAQENAVGQTALPTGVTISDGEISKTVFFNEDEQVYTIGTGDLTEVTLSVNGTSENDNIYINNQRVASGEGVRFEIPEEGERLVRVIVQNGDAEPSIVLLKIMRGMTPDEKAVESIRQIYEQTGATQNAAAQANAPQVGSVGGEWLVLGLARSGYEISDEYYQNVVRYVCAHANEKEQLDPSASTDNSRLILALTAAGYDITDVGGHNLLQGLSDESFIEEQGINGPIFALLALDSHAYDIPENSNPAKQTTREALIAYILNAQLENGGWSLTDTADVDLTAMALQALAPYRSDEAVAAAIEKALIYLSDVQEADGGYSAWGASNSNSAAQVVTALSALGIDARTDKRFVKNGVSVIEAMCGFYTGKGTFLYTEGMEANQMATEQSYYALAAYFRMLDERNALYDMTDVELRGHTHGYLPAFDENGHWSVCDCGEKTESQPHTYGAWTVTKTATEKEAGERERTCTVCGYVQKESVAFSPKTGDDAQLFIWAAMSGTALLALAVLALLKKRSSAK